MERSKHSVKKLDCRWLLAVVAICAVVLIAVCVILLVDKDNHGGSSSSDNLSSMDEAVDPYAMDKMSKGYYYIGQTMPEFKKDRITAIVNEMYYTNGGHLCLNMTLGNGSDKAVKLKSLDVKVVNGYSDAVIAECYTEDITEGYTIAPNGAKTYRLYIEPSQVKIAYDLLDAPLFTIKAVGSTV